MKMRTTRFYATARPLSLPTARNKQPLMVLLVSATPSTKQNPSFLAKLSEKGIPIAGILAVLTKTKQSQLLIRPNKPKLKKRTITSNSKPSSGPAKAISSPE